MAKAKIKWICITAGIAGLITMAIIGGVAINKAFSDEKEEVVVVTKGEEIFEISDLEIGAIQEKIKETYVATTPIKKEHKPENKTGNWAYKAVGMTKEITFKYNAAVHWGYRGTLDKETVKYDSKEKSLTIKEPQLTAFYIKKIVDSDQKLGWLRYFFDNTSYDDMKFYDEQANAIIEQMIQERIDTGRKAVQDSIRQDIKDLIANGVIKVPINEEKITFEESKEELQIINEELDTLAIEELENELKEEEN